MQIPLSSMIEIIPAIFSRDLDDLLESLGKRLFALVF